MAFQLHRLLPDKRFKHPPKNQQFKGSLTWKKVLKTLLLIAGGFFVIGLFSFTVFAAWISRNLPDPNSLSTREVAQSTKIFDRTGNHLLYDIHGDKKRTLIKIEDIPEYAKHATIAIEDKGFYEHKGVYWKGLIRAVFIGVFTSKRIQGTSTLTQQLVKNAILTNERSLIRKVKEFVLALQLERNYNKDQILQLYFNEIPYGSTIYGIESASQTYFGKPAKELTLDEAALLAAIPQSPDTYSPYGTGTRGDNRVLLVGRQHYIIDLMASQKYISSDEAEAAKKIETLKKLLPRNLSDLRAPHFSLYVRSLLEQKYGAQMVAGGGLRVITTLDWNKQQIAEAAVLTGVKAKGEVYGFTNAALIALDPNNGQVLTMVGSKDIHDEKDGYVNMTLRPRQPGSSFKPIVYAVGFMRGFAPETKLWDVNTVFKTDLKDYAPYNYDLKERGPVSLRQALQGSLNTPAVKMLYLVGVSRVLDFAELLGYTTLDDRSRFSLALVLGGGEVKPIEHAAAFATFANEGIRYPTAAILKVEDASGKTLEEWAPSAGTRAMDEQIARTISNILSDNASRAFIFGAKNFLTLPDRPVAAKTGTTNDNHDAWAIGYTPDIVTAVWVGNNDYTAMKKGADGSIVAAPIWQEFMRGATKTMPVRAFTPPNPFQTNKPALFGMAFEQKIRVNKLNGKRATDQTPAELVEEQTFYQPHNILYYVDKDDPTGPPPTNPATDPQYGNWEAAVQRWVQKNQWHTTSTPPVLEDDTPSILFPEVDVGSLNNSANIDITEPSQGSLWSRTLFPKTVTVNFPDPARYRRVTVSFVSDDLQARLIAVLEAPITTPWSFRVPAGPEAGHYLLTVTGTLYNDQTEESKVSINVLP